MIGEVQRDASIALAEWFDADPHDLAGRGDRIKVRGIVAIDPRGKNLGLENRGREGRALELFDRVEQRIRAVTPPDDSLPRRGETASTGWSTGSIS